MAAPDKDTFPSRPRIIFMGTPDFAIPALKALIRQGHQILAVVTQPDRPRGRGKKMVPSPVKRTALEHDLPVLQPEKAADPQFCEQLREMRPDLLIVIAFGQILRKKVLDIPGWGAINVHASLLPKFRGAAPIQWAILEDEEKTGLTIMRMDEGLDTGAILFQEEVAVHQDETAGHLHDRLAEAAGDLIVASLEKMHQGAVEGRPQDDSASTYAPKIGKNMIHIDWSRPAPEISALIRALDPVPGARTTLSGKEVKVFASRVLEEAGRKADPGLVLNHRQGTLVVKTGRGCVGIGEIQAPGRKRMPVADFMRGFSIPEETILGE